MHRAGMIVLPVALACGNGSTQETDGSASRISGGYKMPISFRFFSRTHAETAVLRILFFVCGVAVCMAQVASGQGKEGGTLNDPDLKYVQKNDQGYEEYEHVKTGMVLIHIPSGEFQMGSEDGRDDEKPVHQVKLGEYLIGKYEVTNAQYRKFCAGNPGHAKPAQPPDGYGYANYFSDPKYDDYPVVEVTWEDGKAFCEWAGMKLPTEAQWEYAARGHQGGKYPWGNEDTDGTRANYDKKNGGGDYTGKVGSYPRGVSPFGAMDMAGNAWEWCADWYGETYYGECDPAGVTDPTGPPAGSNRVMRGGSWFFYRWVVRATFRLGEDPGHTYFGYGFRVARGCSH